MKKERRILTPEEVEKSINNTKAIWGIEGMEMPPEEEKVYRAYLSGKITEEEFDAYLIDTSDR